MAIFTPLSEQVEIGYDVLDRFRCPHASRQGGEEILHSYNARNQLIRTQEGEAVTDYRYDLRGNLTQVLENGTVRDSYVFDATGRMTQAVSADRGRAEYRYNGFLKRVSRLEGFDSQSAQTQPDPTRELRNVLDLTRPYDDLLATEGAEWQNYAWGNELLAAEGENPFRYLQDHLDSPIRLVGDGAGETLAYDEFGVPMVEAGGSLSNPFGFTGYQMDEVSGLYFAQARFYSPSDARFVSEDPIKDQLN